MENHRKIRQKIIEVLERGYLLSIGTVDDGGPWVADVRYVSDDDCKIYWMSDPNCRHSKAVEQNSKIAATIELNYSFGTPNLGVQISGNARKLDHLNPELTIKYATRRGKPEISSESTILNNGHDWYELTPDFIELIDEKNFGFKKQKMVL